MMLEELRVLLARHARPDSRTPIDDVLISKVGHSTPPIPAMSGAILAVIAQGEKRIALGDRVFVYGPGQYLIASVDLPVTGQFLKAGPDRPALGVGLRLRPALIAEVLLRAEPGDLPAAADKAPSGLAVTDASDELLDAVIRLVRLIETPRDAAVLAPLIKREIIWRVLTGADGDAVRQLGLADSSLTRIARSVQWIRDNYARAFQVEHLARLAGMSVSAFHRNFQAVTATSPIQFQKQIRLQNARLLLAERPSDVTGVSRAVGYDSPSQFSREYRRQFGAPPSRDAARIPMVSTGPPAL